jgi:surfactin synthase thioesterase subunit
MDFATATDMRSRDHPEYDGKRMTTTLSSPLSQPASSAWFSRTQPRPAADLRLFCFPWSGATSSAYRTLASQAPAEIEVVGVELPGRASRSDEPASERLEPLGREIARALRVELLGSPGQFALFGHSFGALLAYEVARRLEDGGIHPRLVVLSGSRAPSVAPPIVLHRLTDEQLMDRVRLMGGTSEERLHDPGFLAQVLPLIRADLTACETYHPARRRRLTTAVSAWAGSADWYAPPERVARWRQFAGGAFRKRLFVGGHFFTRDHEAVMATLLGALRWARARSAAAADIGYATVTALSHRRLAA